MFRDKKDTIISIVLHGLTGPINGKKYPTDMPALGSNNDEWVASVLSYLRYNLEVPEQYAGMIPPQYFPQILVRPEEVQRCGQQQQGETSPGQWKSYKKVENKGQTEQGRMLINTMQVSFGSS